MGSTQLALMCVTGRNLQLDRLVQLINLSPSILSESYTVTNHMSVPVANFAHRTHFCIRVDPVILHTFCLARWVDPVILHTFCHARCKVRTRTHIWVDPIVLHTIRHAHWVDPIILQSTT